MRSGKDHEGLGARAVRRRSVGAGTRSGRWGAIGRVALATVVVTGLAVSPAGAAKVGPPIGGVYGCYGNGGNGLQYDGSFKLVSRSSYLAASDQAGKRLVGKTVRGTVTISGKRLRFLTGPYAHQLGLWITKSAAGTSRINLYKPTFRNWTGISCQLA